MLGTFLSTSNSHIMYVYSMYQRRKIYSYMYIHHFIYSTFYIAILYENTLRPFQSNANMRIIDLNLAISHLISGSPQLTDYIPTV